MAQGNVLHWQAKIGMCMIAIGSIGLFLASQGHLPSTGVLSLSLLITALLGLLLLMLSVGVDHEMEQLSETSQLAPTELVEIVDKVLGLGEEK